MEWLEAILKSAKVTDGALDVSAAVEAIKKEIPNHFVAKTDFNAKAKEFQTLRNSMHWRLLYQRQVAKTYKKALPHIFPTGQKKQVYSPDGGIGGDGGANPFAKETWNLTKQGQMLRDNLAEAKELAAAAGVRI